VSLAQDTVSSDAPVSSVYIGTWPKYILTLLQLVQPEGSGGREMKGTRDEATHDITTS
jgi:hypothetical protein